ncbi:hemin uptake protein HemP [Ramlibacter sp. B156]|uniref:Hemin uptake protein HemP n=2 Tax=Ramlibacter montanisoli TaxID=2732512 RepID=A0A849K8D1_9BURK|nr:hemin uptake protein HemP [Ramlibacter montanisoli]
MSGTLPPAQVRAMELRAPDAHADAPRPAPLPSEALLRGRRLVEISHNGEVYRLQSTRLGKLILTK